MRALASIRVLPDHVQRVAGRVDGTAVGEDRSADQGEGNPGQQEQACERDDHERAEAERAVHRATFIDPAQSLFMAPAQGLELVVQSGEAGDPQGQGAQTQEAP